MMRPNSTRPASLHRRGFTLALLCGLALLQGCQSMTRERPKPNDPAYAPVRAPSMTAQDEHTGGIYRKSRNYSLYGDSTALNVGDILTVTLQESTTASKSAESTITKDNEIGLGTPSFFGRTFDKLSGSANMERDFEGEAEADQSNSLAGSITVTVVEVLPNGVLHIRGEKWISLTNGDEYIRLNGLVRPEDISPDNTVSSQRIADARFAYGGTGDFDQANQPGWLTRFFNSEWWPL